MHTDRTNALLVQDFNSRVFLTSLRRHNERQRDIERHPSSGLQRLADMRCVSSVPSRLLTDDGMTIMNELSEQLLDESLGIVRARWQRSQAALHERIEQTQADLSGRANLSLKRSLLKCQTSLAQWHRRMGRWQPVFALSTPSSLHRSIDPHLSEKRSVRQKKT